MINLEKDTEKNEILRLIDDELVLNNISLEQQTKLNGKLLLCLKKYLQDNTIININYKLICLYLDNTSKYLKDIDKNIIIIQTLITRLEDIKTYILFSDEFDQNQFESQLAAYNQMYTENIPNISANLDKIEDFIRTIIPFRKSYSLKKGKNINDNVVTKEKVKENSELVENTLIISELKQKVILPYRLEEVEQILNNYPKKYHSLEEVIADVYTLPLKYYKNAAISRYKEAFDLVYKKEHKSIFQAISLGFELLSNYNLHPAIISACKNIDELDIYLSCLEYDELDDFHFFKVIYEMPPSIVKEKKEHIVKEKDTIHA